MRYRTGDERTKDKYENSITSYSRRIYIEFVALITVGLLCFVVYLTNDNTTTE